MKQPWNVPYKGNYPVSRRISQTTPAAGAAHKAAQSKHYEEKLEI